MTTLFRRILVPHDFSDHAAKALRVAADLVAQPGGRIRVLHAIAPFFPTGDVFSAEVGAWVPPPDLLKRERERLQQIVARTLRDRAEGIDCRVVIGDPYQCIMDAVRGMDSIIMTTAGRTGLTHLLIGSVAEKVVRHSPIPVLTLRPSVAKGSHRR